MNDPEFQGNETRIFEDPRDNFHYHNYLNPAQQHISWMYQWKKQHWDIHQACKELGQATHTDEYIKGFMDGISIDASHSIPPNINRMEDDVDGVVRRLMGSN
jgi:hypothetical protein